MKFNIKSKFGFTLIELLVVIGILAVLAAIAIPSVAGLIDRANLSADATNSNEMTNAVERFVSEYELYVQDIASGRLDTSNLDSAQGRVYNVTGVTDRAGIEGLEKDATAGVDTTGKAIYRDTKYPVNAETMQAVVENYMKTSSTTFTPKQSDCHYYYSPDCGLVVCTETEKSDVTDLNALVHSGKDAKGKDLGATTKWIDLTANITGEDNTKELIAGATFTDGIFLSWDELKLESNGTKYSYAYDYINDTVLTDFTFDSCNKIQSIVIPQGITKIECEVFWECTSLSFVQIPHTVTEIQGWAFEGCNSLTNITFTGTKSQWNAIKFDSTAPWNNECPEITITCTDGVIIVPANL